MKSICTAAALFCLLLAPSARYSVIPQAAAETPAISDFSQITGILEQAQALFAEYGSRPPYTGPQFAKNKPLSVAQAEMVLPYILACESGARNISEIDSNHKMSRGPAQFQDATWKERQEASGIPGAPTQAIPAVEMSLWSLENGYIAQWSCARLEHIMPA